MRADRSHVLVTGAAGGIGLAVAAAFAARGDAVTGVDARERLLAEQMAALGGHPLPADLSSPDCGSVVTAAAERAPVDVLVNAAGIYPATTLAEMSAERWDHVQHVNVRAPMLLTRAFAAQPDPGGAVVNISSSAATRARSGAAHYCTSKAAVEMLTKACAVELAPLGIRVNAVAPGFVEVDSEVNPISADYARAVSVNLAGRAGQPHEIAAAVVWVAGPETAFMTGSVVRVDGGATAGNPGLPLHHDSMTELQGVGR